MNGTASIERRSAVMQITGQVSPVGRAAWLDTMAFWFNNPMFHKGFEAEKTDEQLGILEGILRWLPEFVRSFNGQPLTLTPSHYHFANNTDTPRLIDNFILHRAHGIMDARRQEIWLNFFHPSSIDYYRNPLNFADTVSHEGLHFEAFNTLKPVPRREPFSVDWAGLAHYSNGQYMFQLGNEAVTTELQRVYAERYYSQIPLLAREMGRTGRFYNYESFSSSERPNRPYEDDHLKLENLILRACLQLGYNREKILQTLGRAYFTRDWTGMAPIMHSFNSPDSIEFMKSLNEGIV